MEIAFLTPLGALVALAALVPLGVYRARGRRVGQIRAALGLDEPTRTTRLSLIAALVAVCGPLALAAAQPVIATSREVPERTDAQVFLVLDTSRSHACVHEAGNAHSVPTRTGDRPGACGSVS